MNDGNEQPEGDIKTSEPFDYGAVYGHLDGPAADTADLDDDPEAQRLLAAGFAFKGGLIWATSRPKFALPRFAALLVLLECSKSQREAAHRLKVSESSVCRALVALKEVLRKHRMQIKHRNSTS